jgi:UDP-glucose:glycoprotein glucosyltransferase
VGLKELGTYETEEQFHDGVLAHCVESEFLRTEDISFVDFSLSMHRYSARIQSQYQYYETAVLPKVKEQIPEDCENLLYYNGKASCDTDSVFALETSSGDSEDVELLPTDRSLGENSNAPIAILYADLETDSFSKFHSHLSASALEGKIQYIVRYKPPKDLESRPKENLAGYGLELALKRTDYLVIDDRDGSVKDKDDVSTDENDLEGEDEPETDKKLKKDDNVLSEDAEKSVSKAKLPTLGYRAANYIMNHKNPFEALVNVSLDFPKYSGAISELQPERSVFKDVKQNAMNGLINPGQNSILVNGAPAFSVDDSVFTLLDLLDRERGFIRDLTELGLDESTASDLINKNVLADASVNAVNRYDYRSNGLIWLNDIETDEQYKNWPDDVQIYLDRDHPGQFYPIRHNTNSLVFTVDFSNPVHHEILAQAFNILSRGMPIQIGVIPLVNSYEAKTHAANLQYLEQNHPTRSVITYITSVLSEMSEKEAMNRAVKNSDPPNLNDYPEVDQIIEACKQWESRFDIGEDEMVIFANGHLIEASNTWLFEASTIFQNDLEIVRGIITRDERDPDIPFRDHFIKDGLTGRNKIVNPVDPATIKYMDTSVLYDHLADVFDSIPTISTTADDCDYYSTQWFFADFANADSLKQAIQLVKFVAENKSQKNIRVYFVPVIDNTLKQTSVRTKRNERVVKDLQLINRMGDDIDFETVISSLEAMHEYYFGAKKDKTAPEDVRPTLKKFGLDEEFRLVGSTNDIRTRLYEQVSDRLRLYWGLQRGMKLVVDGRIVPIPKDKPVEADELHPLLKREESSRSVAIIDLVKELLPAEADKKFKVYDEFVSRYTRTFFIEGRNEFFISSEAARVNTDELVGENSMINVTDPKEPSVLRIFASIDPVSPTGQQYLTYVQALSQLPQVSVKVLLNPTPNLENIPLKRFYRASLPLKPSFSPSGSRKKEHVVFSGMSKDTLYNMEIHTPTSWIVNPAESIYDPENIILDNVKEDKMWVTYELKHLLLEGHCRDVTVGGAPRGISLDLGTEEDPHSTDTIVMANLGYMQFQANPGLWVLNPKQGRPSEIFNLDSAGVSGFANSEDKSNKILISKMTGATVYPRFSRKKGKEREDVLDTKSTSGFFKDSWNKLRGISGEGQAKQADINIFTVASGHLYERFLSIMTSSVMKHTNHTVKFWLIEDFLSPSFKEFVPYLADQKGFEYEFVTYKWPHWLRGQSEKQRTIWGYKILFLDVLFPQSLDKVLFVDADQIVRTDLKELVDMDLDGAPYGYTPMCDSRTEIEGFRFWKQGFWKRFLGDELKYHISALYVVDLNRFREIAAGDRLRQHYQQLSADPESLSNLDQDLPNHMQRQIPIFSLPQDWLWCETWCSDESLKTAKTIDLCNNPMTKEPKLDRARRQVPEWVEYDNEIANLADQFHKLQDLVHDESPSTDNQSSKPTTQEEEETDDFVEHDEL